MKYKGLLLIKTSTPEILCIILQRQAKNVTISTLYQLIIIGCNGSIGLG